MPFYAVLDTCVLVPMPLRDTLLRLAAEDVFVPKWTARSIASVKRILVDDLGKSEAQVARLDRTLRAYFEDAEVPEPRVSALEPAMGNDPDDRYVLAAAVAGGAEEIVTFNLKHFPPTACLPHGVRAIHPDDFLLDLLQIEPSVVTRVVLDQAAALRKPPVTAHELLDKLESASPGVPNFVAAMRSRV